MSTQVAKAINIDKQINVVIPSNFVILCDLDGTIIDTDYANYLSYKLAFEKVTQQKHNLQFNLEKRFNRTELKKLIPQLTDKQFESIISLKTHYFSKYLPETTIITPMADFIKHYSKTHKIVLVTCSRMKRAIETLQYHNMLGYFSRLICWESISNSELSNKYASAFYFLNANPVTSIVCENDLNEIRNAQIAGVPKENIVSVKNLEVKYQKSRQEVESAPIFIISSQTG